MRAVLLGMGGLGCPAALALAEAARALGLPLRLVLVDPDRVERGNLARQILYRDADVGRAKAEVAAERLSALIAAEPAVQRFERATAPGLLARADVLLDGTDDAATRFFANDAALAAGVPLVHGAALGWRGQILTILPGRTACLRCLFEGPPDEGAPGCAQAGVLGPLCGVVGAAMAAEALAVLRGEPPRAASTLISWDARTGRERAVAVPRDPDCSACGHATSDSNRERRRQKEETMSITVRIPAPLRPLTQNQAEVAVEGLTVIAAVEELERRYPGLKARLLDDKGALRRYINIFRNEEDIRQGQTLQTELHAGDKLTIVPAIAGGY
jgi:molybdopterin/thiamine biosynthesis adenylyltransferase/molybdopterin converting factor small subunit